jgi:Na+-transporting methylmalonyl-CoA/oxaloacetate decarboxylase gamma subunit
MRLLSLVADSPEAILALSEFEESGLTMLFGFVLVLLVLSLLALVTAAVGSGFIRDEKRRKQKAAEAVARAATASRVATVSRDDDTGATEVTEPLLVVLAAAVHSVMGERPHRMVSVHHSESSWAQEGRRQIFSSHRVR